MDQMEEADSAGNFLTALVGKGWISTKNVSRAVVKMEIPVLARALKSCMMCFTSFQMDKTLWGVFIAVAVDRKYGFPRLVLKPIQLRNPRFCVFHSFLKVSFHH